MREIPEGISDADLIRRLKDKIVGYKHQIKSQIKSNAELYDVNSKLFEFIGRNNLWHLYHKQEEELNK